MKKLFESMSLGVSPIFDFDGSNTLFESVSVGAQVVFPTPMRSHIFDSFSAGLVDKRYPISGIDIFNSVSIGIDNDIEYYPPKIIRVI